MKALVFTVRLNSLYSIRVPFTWQSALTYPILPPSAVIGLIANALQRKNNIPPLKCLELLEQQILWAGSRLLTPCIIKSYTTSAIVKWEDVLGGKFTNALGRQFAYTKEIEVLAIFKTEDKLNDIVEALKITPLTCGDSESLCSLESIEIKNVSDIKELENAEIETQYPLPFDKSAEIIEGGGQLYLMHERCQKQGNKFPLLSYVVPIKEDRGILVPTVLKVKISKGKVCEVEHRGYIVLGI